VNIAEKERNMYERINSTIPSGNQEAVLGGFAIRKKPKRKKNAWKSAASGIPTLPTSRPHGAVYLRDPADTLVLLLVGKYRRC